MPDALSGTKQTRCWIRPVALALALSGLLGFSRCSDLQDSPGAPNGPAAKVHPEGWLNPAARESFHGHAIRSRGWDMAGCRSCHGEDYSGGSAGGTCLTCHAESPEACSVCHGSAAGAAPPEDLQGNEDTSRAGVGAHQTHLNESAATLALECAECHVVPQEFTDPAHIDGDGRAEVVWGERARTGGAEPHYDPEAHTCADTYCHSGGKYGSNPTLMWTDVGTGQGDCGTCHGMPPTAESTDGDTHLPGAPDSCSNCHPNVVDEENAIADKARHLDGDTSF